MYSVYKIILSLYVVTLVFCDCFFFNAVRLFQCIGDTSLDKDRQLC